MVKDSLSRPNTLKISLVTAAVRNTYLEPQHVLCIHTPPSLALTRDRILRSGNPTHGITMDQVSTHLQDRSTSQSTLMTRSTQKT